MILEKAIEILEATLKVSIPDFDQDERDAIQLGIEALKVFDRRRKAHAVTMTGLLPGETEE